MTAVFTILLLLLTIALCVFAHLYFDEKEEKEAISQALIEWKDKVITLTDKAPESGKRAIDNVLALSDQLKGYVKKDGGQVKITVLKD